MGRRIPSTLASASPRIGTTGPILESMNPELAILIPAAVASWLLTLLMLRYLNVRGIVDVPNQRSSHSTPTPRGGGLAIVIVTILGVLLGASSGWVPASVALALGGGGALVALVGWVDDTRGLAPSVRLLAHVIAAAWLVFCLGGIVGLRFGSTSAPMRWIGDSLSVLAITWAISAYNFMDGIDALAGSEAVWVGFVGGGMALASGDKGVAFVSLLLAFASAGFLVWNFPPAKIFLGDVGSGFLGYGFAVIALFSARAGSLPVIAWLVLLGAFAFDSTITLIRRMVRREAWYSSHRLNAYQRVALRVGRHGPVTLAIMLLNVLLAVLCLIGWRAPDQWRVVALVTLGMLVLAYLVAERFSPMVKA